MESDGIYHILSLKRVLRNGNANNYRLSLSKKLFGEFTDRFRIYSSNVLTRRLRMDKDLIDLMLKSEYSFSLLRKLETFDAISGIKRNYMVRRPVLVISFCEDKNLVCD